MAFGVVVYMKLQKSKNEAIYRISLCFDLLNSLGQPYKLIDTTF